MNRFIAGVTTVATAGNRNAKIDKQDVVAAQQEWGEGIMAIAKIHADGGDFETRASEHIDALYAYGESPVMFKPTLASDDQFRETFDEALSYFIGTQGTEDHGFATKGWSNVRGESNGIYTDKDSAIAMGNYFFTGADGKETEAEYTFGYILDDQGDLKINLHHSSLPFSA
ncbi:MAG: phosphoribosyl-AMP cyclohydrolase [Cyanobacteria bacterium P01_F01_bin.3]